MTTDGVTKEVLIQFPRTKKSLVELHMTVPTDVTSEADAEAFIAGLPEGALRHAPVRRPPIRPGDGALESYLRVGSAVLQAARGIKEAARQISTGETGSTAAMEFARQLWPRYREARVFEIPTMDWKRIMVSAAKGINDVAYPEGDDSEELDQTRSNAMWEAAREIPLAPEAMPFPQMFIGLREPGPLLHGFAALRYVDGLPPGHIQSTVVGWLVVATTDGEVEVTEMCEVWTATDSYIMPCVERIKGLWGNPSSLAPFIVPALLALTKGDGPAKRTQHTPGLNTRAQYKEVGKLFPHTLLPKPYYTIAVTQSLVEQHGRDVEASTKEAAQRALRYRHDRSAHERVLVRRGTGILDAELHAKLIARGYKFWYQLDELDDVNAARLTDRGHIAKMPEEWIAILVTNVRATIVGDETLPYIPGLRLGRSQQQEPDGAG